jgi:polysaccharide export outer membrane protein
MMTSKPRRQSESPLSFGIGEFAANYPHPRPVTSRDMISRRADSNQRTSSLTYPRRIPPKRRFAATTLGRWLAACAVWFLAGSLVAWAQSPEQEYRIGAKDVLKITVWGHEDLSRTVVVAVDGTFQFPLVGNVQAVNLTAAQIGARLKELLGRDYLVDPQVSVAVQEYRSQRVFVLGEAEKPGTYPLMGRTTLLDILSQAGGPSKSAARQVVVVRFPRSTTGTSAAEASGPTTPGAAGSTMLRANLKKLLDGDAAENITLQNGDTIYVPKLTSFFVLGEVQRQGSYAMEKETTTLEAITLAGGFTDRAAPREAKILRKRADGTQETIDVDLTDLRARELHLAEGDTLLIPRGNTFFVLGEVRKPGAYQLDTATTAVGAITLAGGFTEKAAQSQAKLTRRLPSGTDQTTTLDLSGAAPLASKFFLKDADVLVIPTGNTFYVMGEVKKPGAYQLEQLTTAIQAIAMAGGFTDKAAPNRTKIIRTHPGGRQETLIVDLNEVIKRDRKEKDPPIAANDVIIVPESFFESLL